MEKGAMYDPNRPQGLWSIPGDGVLARQGNLILLCSIDERGIVESLLGLLTRVRETGGDGRALADAIGAAVENDRSWGGLGQDPGPSVVAFGPAGGGLAVMVSGTAWAEITTASGTCRLTAGQPSMLLRSVVGIPVRTVRGGLGDQGPDSRTDRFSRLDSGTVRACGLSYYSGHPEQPASVPPGTPPPAQVPHREPAPAAPAPPEPGPAAGDLPAGDPAEPAAGDGLAEPAPEPAADEHGILEPGEGGPPQEAATAIGPAARPEPEQAAGSDAAAGPGESPAAPIVLGLYCKNGHFGDPEARSCAVCGEPRGKRPPAPQPGPRPPLGVLVRDDGAKARVDRDYVIGREPEREPSVAAGKALPLPIVDAGSTVSRIHARLHLDGWQVLLTDLGSANGTRIRPPGAKSEQPLDPQVPVPLRHGTRVFVGTTGLRYEPPPG